MAEMTDREKEFELLGMGVDDLEKMIRSRMEHQNLPLTEILIDWLELAQYQLEDRYKNVHHIINRIVYVLHTEMVVDNEDKIKSTAKNTTGGEKD